MSLLRTYRRVRTLSLQQLAGVVGCDYGYLSKIERGLSTPSPDLQLRLAAVLGVTVETLWPPEDAGRREGVAS